jgi:hypothetical protein
LIDPDPRQGERRERAAGIKWDKRLNVLTGRRTRSGGLNGLNHLNPAKLPEQLEHLQRLERLEPLERLELGFGLM